jgi:hypothetical protein
MSISVNSSTLASTYASRLLGPSTTQINGGAQDDAKAAQTAANNSKTDGGGATDAAGQGKPANFQARPASGGQPAGDSASNDPVSQLLKQLQEQLRQVLQQIQRLRASSIPDEQKAAQLQALNSEATTLQNQIAQLLQKQMEAAKGVVTA